MEKKVLNQREIGQIKRICQNVIADFEKVEKLNAKIADLTAERDEIQAEIDEMEAPVMRKTGYKSTDIISKIVVPAFNADGTPKMDKEFKYQMKTTKWVLRYPDTILPPANVEENVEETTEVPSVENAGNDYDLDCTPSTNGAEEPSL